MKTLTIQVPDSVSEEEIKMYLAVHLFEKGVFSTKQAADLAGISKNNFIENVFKYGGSVFGESI